jgi:hypothetical protein
MITFAALVVTSLAFADTTHQDQPDPGKQCVPHFENGQPSGYTCTDSQPAVHQQSRGLENGSSLEGSSGQPIDEPKPASE